MFFEKKLNYANTLIQTELESWLVITNLILLSVHWNIQTADLSLSLYFLIHLKIRELDPLTNHIHGDCDDFS